MIMETWVPVTGWGGRYEVSDRGRVYSYYSRRLLSLSMGSNGRYPQVKLSYQGVRANIPVHDLVLREFDVQPEPGQWALHRNDIKTDNRWPENLYWGWPVDNCTDRDRNGNHPRGERNGNAKLTAAQVTDIRSRWAAGERPFHLAREHEISYTTVRSIVTGKSWQSVSTQQG